MDYPKPKICRMFWALGNSPNLHLSEQISKCLAGHGCLLTSVGLLFSNVNKVTAPCWVFSHLPPYGFPVAAVTNYPTLSSFKTTQICHLTVLLVKSLTLASPGKKQGVGRAAFLPGESGGELLPSLCRLSAEYSSCSCWSEAPVSSLAVSRRAAHSS